MLERLGYLFARMESGDSKMTEPKTCNFCARKTSCMVKDHFGNDDYCDFIPYHGILTDTQIKDLILYKIIDADITKVQPTSVDLHLGDEFFFEKEPADRWERVVEKHKGDHVHWSKCSEDFILLSPGQPCLASVCEVVSLPAWLTMELRMTSTEGRDCIQHILAVWADPGFSGRMTLELQNVSQEHSILLSSGDRICQAIFHKHHPVARQYSGRYKGDMGTQPAKDSVPVKDCGWKRDAGIPLDLDERI